MMPQQSTFATQRPENAAEARKALQAGIDSLRQNGYQVSFPESLASIVWYLLQEAADTLARMPDAEMAFLMAGERISWPIVVHTMQERYEAELQRLIDRKMSKEEMRLRRLPITDPSAIPRMFTVLDWLKFIRGRYERRDRRAVLAMALGIPTKRVRWMMGGVSESAPRMLKLRAVQRISEGIKSSCDLTQLVAA